MVIDTRINTTVVLTTAGVALAAIALTTWWQKKRRQGRGIPTKWRRVGELAELTIYPLKSGAGLDLKEAECTELGFQTTDRDPTLRDRFFIVTSGDTMKTSRQYPKLMLIKVSAGKDGSYIFSAPNMNDLVVKAPSVPKKNYFKMWMEESVDSVDVGDEASQWLQTFLGLKEGPSLRLGIYLQDHVTRRNTDKQPWKTFRKHYRNIMPFDMGAFSDFASYLLINEASVADLNKRLPDRKKVAPRWFRSNFVVRGAEALSEDSWNYIKVGDSAVFQNCKPCLRCIVTTINPETAEKDSDMQPLRTLRSYRMLEDKKLQALEGAAAPAMGRYVAFRRPGIVRIGDPIYVEDR